MQHQAITIPKSLMALLIVLIVLFAANLELVEATYPYCSGSVCSASNWPGSTPYVYSGTNYCCANPSDTATYDLGTATCSCQSNVPCPVTAAVAFFPAQGCAGSSTFEQVAGNSASNGICYTSSVIPSHSVQLYCGYNYAAPNAWGLFEWDVCYGTTVGIQTSRTVGIAGDTACFNMGVGSVVVDCTSSAVSRIGTSISSPALHSTTCSWSLLFFSGMIRVRGLDFKLSGTF